MLGEAQGAPGSRSVASLLMGNVAWAQVQLLEGKVA